MFGYSDLVVDPRNIVLMRDAGCPVTCDITHALQQPAGRSLEVCVIICAHCSRLMKAMHHIALSQHGSVFEPMHDASCSSLSHHSCLAAADRQALVWFFIFKYTCQGVFWQISGC